MLFLFLLVGLIQNGISNLDKNCMGRERERESNGEREGERMSERREGERAQEK